MYVFLFEIFPISYIMQWFCWRVNRGEVIWENTSYELRAESLKARVEIQKCEFKSTSYEFKSTSYEFKSTISRIIKSMKTQVNSLKSSSFPKIISPKLFGNSWDNSYVKFLVIISCFTFPLLNGYGFGWKLSELTLTLKEET